MKGLMINFIDGTNHTFNEEFTTNFLELVEWLSSDDNIPFKSNGANNRKFILYKHAIKSVELY